MPRDPYLRNQLIVKRRLIVETKAFTVMPDRVNACRHFDIAARTLRCARRLPIRIIGRVGRVLREGMQNVGDQQFLMLLLVM